MLDMGGPWQWMLRKVWFRMIRQGETVVDQEVLDHIAPLAKLGCFEVVADFSKLKCYN